MKRAFFLLILLTSCASGGSIVSMKDFYEVPIGATEHEVQASVGTPYAIHRKSDGTVEYEYIERIKIGSRGVEERHYLLILKEGKVVSKTVKQSSPLPYSFDSYEMQTTQSASS